MTGNTHINVYAINTKGEEVMMTSDHIVAKARGGGEGLDNRQPMCSVCNNGKGAMELDSLEELEKIPPSHRALMSNLSLASVEDLQYKLEEDRLAIENAMAKLAEEDETRDWNEVLEKRTKTYLATKQELSTRATQPKKSNSEAGGSWDVGSLFD